MLGDMTISPPSQSPHATQAADAAVELVHRWLGRARTVEPSARSNRLTRLVAHPDGLAFTVDFVDGVIRPHDRTVAARNLARVARRPAPFLSRPMRLALAMGGRLAPFAPWLAIPVTRKVLRGLVGHLVLDARPRKLRRGLARLTAGGVALNVNMLGEAVLGAGQAAARRAGTIALIERDDVDYVSLKVSSIVPPQNPWGFVEAVDRICEALEPVYEAAARTGTFVNLDMEEYKDLALTLEVFTRVLDQPRFASVNAGIVLQAYLPDSLAALDTLHAWAARRMQAGGRNIKVRIVKGANLSMERVDAEWRGWPLATWTSKEDTDAQYKRLLDAALRPEHTAHVEVGVAGHNLFDLAHAWLLASERGVAEHVDVEMLLGMAERLVPVIAEHTGPVRLYTPAVPPAEFDVAIAYLVRRLEEVANPANFLSSAARFEVDPAGLRLEEQRFREAMSRAMTPAPQAGRAGAATTASVTFANQPDTDPAIERNRDWARAIAGRAGSSALGKATIAAAWLDDEDQADEAVARAAAAGDRWGAIPPADRAALLETAAEALQAARADLLEVMAAEAGKTIDQGDPEVSEVVDFARYYAQCARDLDKVPGARPVPRRVTLVTPPWNFPIAIPGGSTLAALAAGSAVILKPAPATRRCAAVLAEVLWASGIPRDVLQLVDCDEESVGSALVRDERVDQIILTGAYDTAELFTRLRPGARLLAETSGKNAIIVTPSADLDLAAKDVVQSAFGHAGQKCSAASVLILVGSVVKSRRFLTQLRDAAASLVVGPSTKLDSHVGPLIGRPSGKLEYGLTTLEPGESWLLKPHALNPGRTLWSPGIRQGVRCGAPAHLAEFFGPVLSVMTAPTLEAAIDVANAVDYGLTSGLHSLDASEIDYWLARIDAGNLYVNRGITGAIVRRQPFGGWKRSAVGPGAKAGGPHYVERLTGWEDAGGAFPSDPLAEFAPSDPSGLACERNVLRYVPARAELRVGAGAVEADVLRVAHAAAIASPGTPVTFARAPDATLAQALRSRGLPVTVEPDDEWAVRVTSTVHTRVRALGEIPDEARTANVAIFDDPVTSSARLELFPFLREQAISMTAHRFGTPHSLAQTVEFASERAPS